MTMRLDWNVSDERWDAFLPAAGGGTIFQSSAWSALKAREGWATARIALLHGGEILSGVSLVLRRAPATNLWVAYGHRGPVWRTGAEESIGTLLDRLRPWASGRGIAFLRFNPDTPPGGRLDDALRESGCRRRQADHLAHSRTLRVDLRLDPEAIRAGFETRARTAIRRAERARMEILSGTGPVEMEAFHRLLADTGRRRRFPVPTRDFVRAAVETLGPKGWLRLFVLADERGAPVSAAALALFGGRASYLWGANAASSPVLREGAGQRLQWEMMMYARGRGCDEYDLHGLPRASRPSDPLWGIYLFKRGFGGREVDLAGTFDLVLRPAPYGLLRCAEPLYVWHKWARQQLSSTKRAA